MTTTNQSINSQLDPRDVLTQRVNTTLKSIMMNTVEDVLAAIPLDELTSEDIKRVESQFAATLAFATNEIQFGTWTALMNGNRLEF